MHIMSDPVEPKYNHRIRLSEYEYNLLNDLYHKETGYRDDRKIAEMVIYGDGGIKFVRLEIEKI